ncbi:hypothetical protein MARCHEWKA_01910 [Brevundimonas phage vB_BpoS-Marchewka]|uniref:Uncharacterized protein n=1 Tax=Brevundimonas phage vB_BpoS-Marchewka TaxID=2948604 RepID=A0A9E7N2K6_9CAUD|nr:hypothetical protein MARCHEWKA_01910 [Brevundimonas phage vB_BpoS-Marchewka]UTC29150.1 hypothetical protein BAMBUS_00670 [Brevundimonas phage vB_BpoS-Bambus]
MLSTPAWVKPCTALAPGDIFFVDLGQDKRGRVVSAALVFGGALKVVYEAEEGEKYRLIMAQDRLVCVIAPALWDDDSYTAFGR